MPSEDLVDQYLGHVVPQSYNGGFIALSYLVSLVGAASTLELINRRTGSRGFFNQYVNMREYFDAMILMRLACSWSVQPSPWVVYRSGAW